MNKEYIGPFKDVAPLYIEYKKSLGYDAISEMGALKRMDKYFHDKGINEVKLTREMVEEYTKKRENESSDTRRTRITLTKQFAIFLKKLDYDNVYIHNIKCKKNDSNFKPYIYTKDDLQKIFNHIDAHQYDSNSSYNIVLPIFIRLLYGCGLRKSELTKLLLKDVDFEEKIIKIIDGKGHVSRIVPLSESLYQSYLKYKNKININSEYFICDLKGRKISRHITEYFQKILKNLNILRPDGTPPRLHDFRFTFSINALEKMEKEGQDLYTTLPILSKYLGHKNISATEHYLLLATDYFVNITSKENEYYKDLLKIEVEENE